MRGIKNLFFYDLPMFPHFYSDICNMLKDPKKPQSNENFSCTILYTVYDALRLAGVTGMKRASEMITSKKKMHMVVIENK